MCEPATIALVVGGAVSAYGAYSGGQMQKQLSNYNASLSDENAKIQARAAEDATAQGSIKEDQHRAKIRQFLGKQTAAYGASGAGFSGSVSDTLTETALFGEQDAQTIRANAVREAYGFRVGEANSLNAAAGSRFQGAMAAASGKNKAIGSLITSAGAAYGAYNSWFNAPTPAANFNTPFINNYNSLNYG